jgi:hypothetical protein
MEIILPVAADSKRAAGGLLGLGGLVATEFTDEKFRRSCMIRARDSYV